MKILSFVSLLFLASLSSCIFVGGNNGISWSNQQVRGSGIVLTQDRPVMAFQSIAVNNSANVTLRQSNEYRVVVRTDDNVMPYITTQVQNGQLVISNTVVGSLNPTFLEVEVSTPNLTNIVANGSGNIGCATPFSFINLEVSLNGSGIIYLRGTANRLQTVLLGSGSIRAFDLPAERIDTRLTGSGNIEVNALQDLYANISGSGNIYYIGSPRLQMNVSGSGKVIRR